MGHNINACTISQVVDVVSRNDVYITKENLYTAMFKSSADFQIWADFQASRVIL